MYNVMYLYCMDLVVLLSCVHLMVILQVSKEVYTWELVFVLYT